MPIPTATYGLVPMADPSISFTLAALTEKPCHAGAREYTTGLSLTSCSKAYLA